MSAFDAKSFRAHLGKFGGAVQNNYFDVVIMLPTVAKKSTGDSTGEYMYTNAEEILKFRAHMSDMPARNLETIDRRYAGPMRNIPVGHTYTTLQLEFIEGGDRATRKIFDTWQASIMDDTHGWNVPYYKDIIAPYIELRLYNRNSTAPAAVYRFYECFPVTIGPSQLAWENKNQIMTIPIEIAYHRWENLNVSPKANNLMAGMTNDTTTAGGLFGAIRQGMKTFRDVVHTVNDINTKVRTAKSQVKQAKQLLSDFKKLKLNTRSLGGLSDSLNAIDRFGQKVGSFSDRVQHSPIFTSKPQTIKKPTPKF
jgi:hypothetical protein